MGDGFDENGTITGDRRADRRYDLHLDLRWTLIRRRRVVDSGRGRTIDVSSGGILFDAGRPVPKGLDIEVAVAWPVLLHGVAPMQLVAFGRVVRSGGTRAAFRMTQHEFRTVGTAAVLRNNVTVFSQPAVLHQFQTKSGPFIAPVFNIDPDAGAKLKHQPVQKIPDRHA